MTAKQTITPCLWMDGTAEAAASLYTSLFPAARAGTVSRYGREGFDKHGQPEGTVMTAEISLAGYDMLLLNGGPRFKLNPSISLFVTCADAAEVDRLAAGLGGGGHFLMPLGSYPWSPRYAWVADRFGVSWQLMLEPGAQPAHAIAPMLMFTGTEAGRAAFAVERYARIVPGSTVGAIARHDGSGPDPAGTVLHMRFSLGGSALRAMDSAIPHAFAFNEAFSLMLAADTQAEIDRYWTMLTADGGQESMCGWLKDPYGVSWQVGANIVGRIMRGAERAAQGRVMTAVLGMRKLDIATLEAAARGT